MPNKLSEFDMVDLVVELASEVESTDSIDWGMFPTEEEPMYKFTAAQIIENMNMIKEKDDKILMLLAVTTKLTVENTVLNWQLLQKQ